MESEKESGALVLIRVERDYVQDFRNAVMRHHSIVHNFNGHVLGITEADDVTVCERTLGWWSPGRYAVSLIEFMTLDEAHRWYHSMPALNQPDFLYGIDVFILPTRHPLPPERRFVLLTDALVGDIGSFLDDYEMPASGLLKARDDVSPGIVATTDARSMRSREGWSPAYIVMHLFNNREAFESFQSSEQYVKIRDARSRVSRVDEVCFELGPLMKPLPSQCGH